ncbi:hypothetical protein [Williamsia maris]|uniref:Uncharacterized protein n=1 Tax=Williamsia maris TaxID=72806 RepID=A0ABT1HDL9_9NOCA|nr:hypothetical protein [Williamsia maris]MCP2175805.1 hypothetical protein [Williamsia maris]
MPSTDGDGAQDIDGTTGQDDAAWVPAVDDEVVVRPDTDTETETTGRIIDDFGEFTAAAVEVNETTISPAARRWAVLTADGDLVFVDTDQIRSVTHPRIDTDGD